MNTQRVEGHTPMECPHCEHQWMHLSPDVERLEKVNEALMRALEDLVKSAMPSCKADCLDRAREVIRMAKEPA